MNIHLLMPNKPIETIFGEKYLSGLAAYGTVKCYDRNDFNDRAHVLEFLKGADVVITSWGTPALDAEMIEACGNLSLVMHAAGSVKPILSDALLAKAPRMTASAAAIGEGVAETALSLVISACKGVYRLTEVTRNGLWYCDQRVACVKDFYDITVGVISAGFVGRHMIKLLKNFHVDILLYDPTLSAEECAALGTEKAELADLLSRSDVVTVHAPSIPATEKMLNADMLKKIPDGAILVNTSRGAVIDEEALVAELSTGRFFACLDVTDPEPPAVDSPLRNMPNVVLTPHIAGTVSNGMRRIGGHIVEELGRYVNGERMRTEIDFERLGAMA
jgi:phosphoglycerate dehydrogenase-like enzyme